MKNEIEITKLEIERIPNSELANVTIHLKLSESSTYIDSCNRLASSNEINFYSENDYFVYEETIELHPASEGILNYLKNLKEGKSYGDTTIACNIMRGIRALDIFWY